jgi:hypothetical protein
MGCETEFDPGSSDTINAAFVIALAIRIAPRVAHPFVLIPMASNCKHLMPFAVSSQIRVYGKINFTHS